MFRLAQAAVAEAEPQPRRTSPIYLSYVGPGIPRHGVLLGGVHFLSLRTVRASHPPAPRSWAFISVIRLTLTVVRHARWLVTPTSDRTHPLRVTRVVI